MREIDSLENDRFDTPKPGSRFAPLCRILLTMEMHSFYWLVFWEILPSCLKWIPLIHVDVMSCPEFPKRYVLFVGPSKKICSGLGVFAAKDFAAGELVCLWSQCWKRWVKAWDITFPPSRFALQRSCSSLKVGKMSCHVLLKQEEGHMNSEAENSWIVWL